MTIYVIVSAYKGCVEGVKVALSLDEAYEQRDKMTDNITDDAQLVEAMGISVKVVESDSSNIKITSGADIAIAAAILKARPKPKPKGPSGPWAAEQGW